MRQTDSAHHAPLVAIFEKHGYPGFDVAGETGAHNFWLLVQHQDKFVDFQQKVLAAMKTEVERNNAPKNDYAYLVDRVMVNTDSVQIYGTQMRLNEGQTSFEPKPLLYPEKVDSLRASVRLPPIADYILMMNARYYHSLKNSVR